MIIKKYLYGLFIFGLLIFYFSYLGPYLDVLHGGMYVPFGNGIRVSLMAYVLLFFIRDKATVIAYMYSSKCIKLYVFLGLLSFCIAKYLIIKNDYTFQELYADKTTLRWLRKMPMFTAAMFTSAILIGFESLFDQCLNRLGNKENKVSSKY